MVKPPGAGTTGCVRRLLVAVCIAAGMSATPALAQQGQLDTSFGNSGKLVIPFDLISDGVDRAHDIAVQADGMIVAVGAAEKLGGTAFAVVRFGPDGTLDPTFGLGGRMTVSFGFGNPQVDFATAVALHPDGAIYLAGPVTGDDGDMEVGIARLDSSGSLDAGFGVGGKAIVPFDLGEIDGDLFWDMALQTDGKVLVAGEVHALSPNVDFGVARLTSSGDPDLTFGSNGLRIVFFDEGGSNADFARAVAVQPDGKIILVGTVEVGAGTADIGVVRLNSNSTNDSGFGESGKLLIAFDGGGEDVDIGTDVALQKDGKMVVVGAAEAANSTMDFAIARINSDGTLDSTFDGDGKATVAYDLGGDWEDWVYSVAINPDQEIVVGGHVDGPNGDRDFGVARLDTNGALDPTFGSGGKTTVAFDLVGGGSDNLSGLVVPSSGGIYVTGSVYVANNGEDIGVAKVIGSVVFGDGFESGSAVAWSSSVP
jgi:uncharacterized delta-60 repeat protein